MLYSLVYSVVLLSVTQCIILDRTICGHKRYESLSPKYARCDVEMERVATVLETILALVISTENCAKNCVKRERNNAHM